MHSTNTVEIHKDKVTSHTTNNLLLFYIILL